jgi:hypothetical protein
MNLKKIKGLRKNRSLPEFKTILNKNIFYKKLIYKIFHIIILIMIIKY